MTLSEKLAKELLAQWLETDAEKAWAITQADREYWIAFASNLIEKLHLVEEQPK